MVRDWVEGLRDLNTSLDTCKRLEAVIDFNLDLNPNKANIKIMSSLIRNWEPLSAESFYKYFELGYKYILEREKTTSS